MPSNSYVDTSPMSIDRSLYPASLNLPIQNGPPIHPNIRRIRRTMNQPYTEVCRGLFQENRIGEIKAPE